MKVLIIHFRSAPGPDWKQQNSKDKQHKTYSAGTDGVSLEMKKRRFLLEEMGHKVAISSAYEWGEGLMAKEKSWIQNFSQLIFFVVFTRDKPFCCVYYIVTTEP